MSEFVHHQTSLKVPRPIETHPPPPPNKIKYEGANRYSVIHFYHIQSTIFIVILFYYFKFTFNCNFSFLAFFFPFLILSCAFEHFMKFAHYKCYHYL